MLLSIQNELDDISGCIDVCATIRTGRPGRPSCAVSEDQLINLFEIGFSATHIACILGVSVRILQRSSRKQSSSLENSLESGLAVENDWNDEMILNR